MAPHVTGDAARWALSFTQFFKLTAEGFSTSVNPRHIFIKFLLSLKTKRGELLLVTKVVPGTLIESAIGTGGISEAAQLGGWKGCRREKKFECGRLILIIIYICSVYFEEKKNGLSLLDAKSLAWMLINNTHTHLLFLFAIFTRNFQNSFKY